MRARANGPAGLKIAEKEAPDLVFLDIKMPQMDGLEVLKKLRAEAGAPEVVILSGHGNVKTAVEATKLGAFDFIEKPPERERILLVARNALGQKAAARREPPAEADLRRALPRWWARARPWRRCWRRCERAAPTNATVLITGESGVGKELVARAIHRNSLRKDGAFVQVNCAAIPEELIESELFGHEKGSFTGATEKQIGKFELAHKGTIFLDEVGDMSLQAPRPRSCACSRRARSSASAPRRPSRWTCGSSPPPTRTSRRLIEKGDFREDLYFRLSVIPIRVPAAARARRGHPRPGAALRPRQFCAENNFRPRAFTPEAMDALKRHALARQRARAQEHGGAAAHHVRGGRHRARAPCRGAAAPRRSRRTRGEPAASLKDFKESAERAFLVQKLRENQWNISATAAAIGTPRSNLYKKLEQYGISADRDG